MENISGLKVGEWMIFAKFANVSTLQSFPPYGSYFEGNVNSYY